MESRPPRLLHTHEVRVYWEDTDAGGVVYYANYLKFFERARTEWLRTLGIDQQQLRERENLIFVVAGARIAYRSPARLDDLLSIEVALLDARRASLTLAQSARLGPRLLAEGEVRIGCVGAGTFEPRRIPNEILQRLNG
jgi:acyl-CoA thioester hydrolase